MKTDEEGRKEGKKLRLNLTLISTSLHYETLEDIIMRKT